MNVYQHKNGFLYIIQQIGKNNTITPNKNWECFQAIPYKTNKNAPKLKTLDKIPNLEEFILKFII